MQQKTHAKPTKHRRKEHMTTAMTARSYFGNLIAIVHRVHNGVNYG